MKNYLIDASITVAFLNKKEEKNVVCTDFMENIHKRCGEGEHVQLYYPIHSMVEANINFRRRKKEGTVETIEPLNLRGPKLYPLDRAFLEKVEAQNLYEKFDTLKGSDAIYAMIAYLEGMTLVTIDNDFDRVADIIDVMKL